MLIPSDKDFGVCKALTPTWPLQAVMMGPLTMAGLTGGSREITANASDLASLVTDVKEEGLVSLKLLGASSTPLGTTQGTPTQHLQHTGEKFKLGQVAGSNAAKMSATFRIVQLDQRYAHCSIQGLTAINSLFRNVSLTHNRFMCSGTRAEV